MKGIYVALDVHFADDPRIMALSWDAEGIYLGAIRVAKRLGTDGTFTRGQARREAYKLSDKRFDAALAELDESGLVTTSDEATYNAPGFLKWNKSAGEIEELRGKRRAAGAGGGKKSWEKRAPIEASAEANAEASAEANSQASAEANSQASAEANSQASAELRQEKTQQEKTQEKTSSASSQASTLRELAFSQSLRPTKSAKAVDTMLEKILDAGHSRNDVEAAILFGVNAWTLAGIEFAISKVKSAAPQITERPPAPPVVVVPLTAEQEAARADELAAELRAEFPRAVAK